MSSPARTSELAVQEVLMSDWDEDEGYSLAPFIETASSIIDSVADCAVKKGTALSDSTLELIERWMAAYTFMMAKGKLESQKVDKAEERYQGKTGMGLDANYYGQTAVRLDPTGCLVKVTSGKRIQPSLSWGGKTAAESIPYDQREGGGDQ
jgi:hypothetical protein